jgi:ADP-heptose:LPS heptosyltransferase
LKNNFSKETFKRILIYRCGTLGDSIVSVPAINLLRKKFPDADYFLMTANHLDNKLWADTIFAEFEIFKDFITYNDYEYKYPWRLINVIKKIKSISPDLVIYLASEKNSIFKIIRDKLFFFMAGSSNFYPIFNNYNKNFISKKKNLYEYPRESVRFVAGLFDLGITDFKVQFNLPLKSKHRIKVDQLLKNLNLNGNDKLIALCPWSKMQSKRWPLERFIAISEMLVKEFNVKIIIVGGKEDSEAISNLLTNNLFKENVFLLGGQLSVLESAELIRRCILYVGNDTGPMHLASAVQVPCVAIFSARAHKESWYPYGRKNIILRKEVECHNCGLEICIDNKIKCLTEIKVEEVYTSCVKILTSEMN